MSNTTEQTVHSLSVRMTHWINVVAFTFLLVTGIGILLAHPALYWGETGYFGHETAFALGLDVNLKHLLWGRNYHFLMAWVFVLNGVVYLLTNMINGHFRRDMLPTKAQWQLNHIVAELRDHLRLSRPVREAVPRYNVLQKISYLLVIFLLCPLMFLTGLSMSPAFTAAFPEIPAFFGGFQSARTLHFLTASTLVIFVLVHLMQIVIVGVVHTIKPMITGKSVCIEEETQ